MQALINNGDDKPVENLLNDFRQQHESDQMLLFMRAVAAYGFLQSPEQSLEILRSLLCADNFDCRYVMSCLLTKQMPGMHTLPGANVGCVDHQARMHVGVCKPSLLC